MLDECARPHAKGGQIFTDEAVDLLVERLETALQFEHYLTLALEEAYKIGQKPVGQEVVESVVAGDISSLESGLIRYGYSAKTVAGLLNVRSAEIKSFLYGQLALGRAEELRNKMLASGIPL